MLWINMVSLCPEIIEFEFFLKKHFRGMSQTPLYSSNYVTDIV